MAGAKINAAAADSAALAGSQPLLRAKRYLVSGRNSGERRFITDMLKVMGASRISQTASAAEADFECLVRRPDMLVWITGAEEMNDVAAFVELTMKRGGKRPPMIAICAACSKPFMQEALRLGVGSVLLRPFSPSRLAAHIVRAEQNREQLFELD